MLYLLLVVEMDMSVKIRKENYELAKKIAKASDRTITWALNRAIINLAKAKKILTSQNN